MKAPECAGIIHTDFQKGFIKAEVMSYADLEKYGTEKAVQEAGRLRLEGKEYVMQDGDICYFRFNVSISLSILYSLTKTMSIIFFRIL